MIAACGKRDPFMTDAAGTTCDWEIAPREVARMRDEGEDFVLIEILW